MGEKHLPCIVTSGFYEMSLHRTWIISLIYTTQLEKYPNQMLFWETIYLNIFT